MFFCAPMAEPSIVEASHLCRKLAARRRAGLAEPAYHMVP
jgi:hypothetical protein